MMIILKIVALLFVIAVTIVLMINLSQDYYAYKLADMNAGYTLPDWTIWSALKRIIGRKHI